MTCGCGHAVEDHHAGCGRCSQWRYYPEVLTPRQCGCVRVWKAHS